MYIVNDSDDEVYVPDSEEVDEDDSGLVLANLEYDVPGPPQGAAWPGSQPAAMPSVAPAQASTSAPGRRVTILFDINGVLLEKTHCDAQQQLKDKGPFGLKIRPHVEELLLLHPHYILGIYSSATTATVNRALHNLKQDIKLHGATRGYDVSRVDTLFTHVLSHHHCQPESQRNTRPGGSSNATIKPLAGHGFDLTSTLLVDHDAHKAAAGEERNLLLLPGWESEPVSDGDFPVLVKLLLQQRLNGVADVRSCVACIRGQLLQQRAARKAAALGQAVARDAAGDGDAPLSLRLEGLFSAAVRAASDPRNKPNVVEADFSARIAAAVPAAQSPYPEQEDGDGAAAAAEQLLHLLRRATRPQGKAAARASAICDPNALPSWLSFCNRQLFRGEVQNHVTNVVAGLAWLLQQQARPGVTAPRLLARLQSLATLNNAATTAAGVNKHPGLLRLALERGVLVAVPRQPGHPLVRYSLGEAAAGLIAAAAPAAAAPAGPAAAAHTAATADVGAGGERNQPAPQQPPPPPQQQRQQDGPPPPPPPNAAQEAPQSQALQEGLLRIVAQETAALLAAGSNDLHDIMAACGALLQPLPVVLPKSIRALHGLVRQLERQHPRDVQLVLAPAARSGKVREMANWAALRLRRAPDVGAVAASLQAFLTLVHAARDGAAAAVAGAAAAPLAEGAAAAATAAVAAAEAAAPPAGIAAAGPTPDVRPGSLGKRAASGGSGGVSGAAMAAADDAAGGSQPPAKRARGAHSGAAAQAAGGAGGANDQVMTALVVCLQLAAARDRDAAAAASKGAPRGAAAPAAAPAAPPRPAPAQPVQQAQQAHKPARSTPQQPAPAPGRSHSDASARSELHDEIVAFTRAAHPTASEQRRIRAALLGLSLVARGLKGWGNAQALAFGSQACGLALPGSDVDIVILGMRTLGVASGASGHSKSDRDGVVQQLHDLADQLVARKMLQTYEVVAAKVPVLKGLLYVRLPEDWKMGLTPPLQVDISLATENGVAAVDFVTRQIQAMPPLRPLLMVTKALLKEMELNEVFTGGLSSYTLFNMVMAHLMMEGHTPDPLGAALVPTQGQDMCAQREAFLAEMAAASLEAVDLGQLLVSLFNRYGHELDYHRQVVSVRRGGIVRRDEVALDAPSYRPRCMPPLLLGVEDPQQVGRDIGSGSFNMIEVRDMFRSAHRLMVELWPGCGGQAGGGCGRGTAAGPSGSGGGGGGGAAAAGASGSGSGGSGGVAGTSRADELRAWATVQADSQSQSVVIQGGTEGGDGDGDDDECPNLPLLGKLLDVHAALSRRANEERRVEAAAGPHAAKAAPGVQAGNRGGARGGSGGRGGRGGGGGRGRGRQAEPHQGGQARGGPGRGGRKRERSPSPPGYGGDKRRKGARGWSHEC